MTKTLASALTAVALAGVGFAVPAAQADTTPSNCTIRPDYAHAAAAFKAGSNRKLTRTNIPMRKFCDGAFVPGMPVGVRSSAWVWIG